jgi:hypothetical protein
VVTDPGIEGTFFGGGVGSLVGIMLLLLLLLLWWRWTRWGNAI